MHNNYSQCPENNCYVAQSGDTLYAISRFYNTSLDDLVEANPHIEPELILPGQTICIPAAPPPVNCPTGSTSYIVQKEDTFYSIARQHKMRLSALLKANPNINPDALLIGQSICIPMISSVYTDDRYKVKLLYPYRWSKIDSSRYEGIDGFFHAAAISSTAPIEEVCKGEAYHKLKPYGAHPVIIDTNVNGRKACFVMPSTDQPMEMHCQSALIAKYATPVEIEGIRCQYLIIRTDKNHLKDISDSLEFLEI